MFMHWLKADDDAEMGWITFVKIAFERWLKADIGLSSLVCICKGQLLFSFSVVVWQCLPLGWAVFERTSFFHDLIFQIYLFIFGIKYICTFKLNRTYMCFLWVVGFFLDIYGIILWRARMWCKYVTDKESGCLSLHSLQSQVQIGNCRRDKKASVI